MIIEGTDEADTLNGTVEDDVISPGAGPDKVDAGLGSDRIELSGNGSSAWDSLLEGGGGVDLLDATSVTKNLRVVSAGVPTFGYKVTQASGIEHFASGSGNDIFVLLPETAGLVVHAGSGFDVLIGGQGNDTLDGGDGVDFGGYVEMYRHVTIKTVQNVATVVSLSGGTDELRDVEYVAFKDGIYMHEEGSMAAQVVRLYEAVLGRAPSAQELDKAANGIVAGQSLSALADGLLGPDARVHVSDDQSASDYVDQLYAKILGRAPDDAGKAEWISRISGGMTNAEVLVGFVDSNEYRSISSAATTDGLFITDQVAQSIAALYHAFAGRSPEQAGFDHWLFAAKSGMALTDIADSFAASPEFAQRTAGLSNSDLVDYMYATALGREADQEGHNVWSRSLDNGLDRGDLIIGFALSAEHLSRIAYDIHGGIDILM